MEYREIRVQWESVQANPSHPWDWRPTDGELDKARRMADGFCNRLKKRLSTKQKKRTRMTREEANQEAMKLAKEMGSTFFLLSESEQARRIGCAWKTWNRTTFFQEAQKRQKQLSNRYAAKGKGSRPVVSFTGALEAVAGEGKKDEVLEQLIADQEADHDPSPLEDGPKRVYIRKRL